MAGGAFQTDRAIFENPIWKNVVEFRLFFFIYGQAVFSKCGVKKGDVLIQRGQYLRSYRGLQADLEYIENRAIKQYPLSTIKRAVDKLVKEKRLKIESTELGTLFTVVNYEQYQGFERFEKENLEQGWNSDGTETVRRRNNNKNVKNGKNEKKEKTYGDFFENIWFHYPRKKGKGSVSNTQKEELYKIGQEEILRCIDRFKQHMEVEKRPFDKYPYGSTFFNSGYVDYLDANYEPEPDKLDQKKELLSKYLGG